MQALCLSCPGASLALQHGGILPREWLAVISLIRRISVIIVLVCSLGLIPTKREIERVSGKLFPIKDL